jgi:hypothetical protein
MLPEPEWGLLPRPGRFVRKLANRPPKNTSFWAGNSVTPGRPPTSPTLSPTQFDAPFGSSTGKEPTRSAPGQSGAPLSIDSLGLAPPSRPFPTTGGTGSASKHPESDAKSPPGNPNRS